MTPPKTIRPIRPGKGLEISIVIPCLNENETVGICVKKAVAWIKLRKISGEVILADNGSTDGSREIARKCGARVVPVALRGYGNALIGGIEAAKGRFLIMGDADDSYDFSNLDPFLVKLRAGSDLVQGCRLPAGGGTVAPGAMPFSHRWIGNPFFSMLAKRFFGAPIHDVYCGLRGFTKDLYGELDMRCTGMEFAVEMIVKSSLMRKKITEVPITLHPDGRVSRTPHLRTFRDGWRTLRFFLLCSPRWLFLYPGLFMIVAGFIVSIVLGPAGRFIGGVGFDVHTLLYGSVGMIIGLQAVLFSIASNAFAVSERLLPADRFLEKLVKPFRLEYGLIFGTFSVALGVSLGVAALWFWAQNHFGPLPYEKTMRIVIPSVTAIALGTQVVLGSFLISFLQLRRR